MFAELTPVRKLMLLNAIAGPKGAEETASGNPVVFTTDLARPLSRLALSLLPRQSGTGDPSPSNVRSIIPWEEVGTWHGGKNLFDVESGENGGINSSGEEVSASDNFRSDFIPIKAGADYTLSATGTTILRIYWFDGSKTFISPRQESNRESITKTSPTNARYMRITAVKSGSTFDKEMAKSCNIMLNSGDSASPFVPYSSITPHPVDLTGITPPVYGGTLDIVSGVLTVEYVQLLAKWKDGTNSALIGDNTRKNFEMPEICTVATTTQRGYCDKAKWRWNSTSEDIHFYINRGIAYVFLPTDTDGETDIQIVGQLETPQTIQLDPVTVNALVGVNTVWSDANNVDVTYLKKG